jgi:hypothetical protein
MNSEASPRLEAFIDYIFVFFLDGGREYIALSAGIVRSTSLGHLGTYEPHMSILEVSQKTEDWRWPLPPVIWTSRTDELAESFEDRHGCRLCRHLSPAVGVRPGRGSRSRLHKERLP